MLLFKLISLRSVSFLVMLLVAPLLLSACTISPVYSGAASTTDTFNLAFASPNSRLEQIVYSQLVARFGRSLRPDALLVTISVAGSAITPGPGSVGLSGTIKITDQSGKTIFSGTRTASASYTGSGQSLASQQASNEAAERAARQLAETIRLTLLGVLTSRANQNALQTNKTTASQ